MLRFLVVGAAISFAVPAAAQDAPADPSAELAIDEAIGAPDSGLDVSAELNLLTDYRFRGVSRSDEDPAAQAAINLNHSSGLYAGVRATSLAGTDSFRRRDPAFQDLGEADVPTYYPDRTWNGRTYVPVTARTTTNLEVFGYVSFVPGDPEGIGEEQEPSDFASSADFTDMLAENNPEWRMDLCDEVIGTWRGENGNAADMTLVWGVPQIRGGIVATAELADLCVDQCLLVEDRFTLIAPDDYRQDFLEIKLFNVRGEELARESLYADDGEDDDEDDADEPAPAA